ncbi:MAG: tRNA lysidine(34) synthetase TilS [Clostridia bacterium]|nr:tRNA lysidine(34) synthetase TilS [Clostridia bacterium]
MIRSVFLDTITDCGMDKAMQHAGVVVAGFSGGWDSSCLLRLLNDWCRDHGVMLAAAHVNHKIRNPGADRDEAFCRRICRDLSVPLYVGTFDVPALAGEWHLGLEEAARRVRYEYFDQVSEILTGSPGKAVIATAHNATDNTETVLFHLLRGTGLHGLCGIDPIRDGRFIRPLIRIPGTDIRRWCADNTIPAVTDETNTDTAYTRNRIRHEILPGLRQITPCPEDSITRMTSLLRRDDDYLEETALSLAGTGTSLPRSTLTVQHPAILSRILRILYCRVSADASAGEVHIRSCMELLLSGRTDAFLDLPGSIRFRMDRNTAGFFRSDEILRTPDDFEIPFDGSDYENPLYRITFREGISLENRQNFTSLLNKEENIYKLSIHKTLDFDKIVGALKIRNRRAGDTFVYGGMTRRVKKLLTDQKLTAEEKSCLPILCDDSGIVWIPGFPLRDGMEYTGEGTPLTVTVLKKY